ncbi:MAG: hypothetical protein KC561_07715, partial [Myxococcales bacterium]|nr:hypothetical protein [Myxococcales bacterium]
MDVRQTKTVWPLAIAGLVMLGSISSAFFGVAICLGVAITIVVAVGPLQNRRLTQSSQYRVAKMLADSLAMQMDYSDADSWSDAWHQLDVHDGSVRFSRITEHADVLDACGEGLFRSEADCELPSLQAALKALREVGGGADAVAFRYRSRRSLIDASIEVRDSASPTEVRAYVERLRLLDVRLRQATAALGELGSSEDLAEQLIGWHPAKEVRIQAARWLLTHSAEYKRLRRVGERLLGSNSPSMQLLGVLMTGPSELAHISSGEHVQAIWDLDLWEPYEKNIAGSLRAAAGEPFRSTLLEHLRTVSGLGPLPVTTLVRLASIALKLGEDGLVDKALSEVSRWQAPSRIPLLIELVQVGSEAAIVPLLEDALSIQDTNVRLAALHAIRGRVSRSLLPLLRKFSSDRSTLVQAQVETLISSLDLQGAGA